MVPSCSKVSTQKRKTSEQRSSPPHVLHDIVLKHGCNWLHHLVKHTVTIGGTHQESLLLDTTRVWDQEASREMSFSTYQGGYINEKILESLSNKLSTSRRQCGLWKRTEEAMQTCNHVTLLYMTCGLLKEQPFSTHHPRLITLFLLPKIKLGYSIFSTLSNERKRSEATPPD